MAQRGRGVSLFGASLWFAEGSGDGVRSLPPGDRTPSLWLVVMGKDRFGSGPLPRGLNVNPEPVLNLGWAPFLGVLV